MCWPTRLPVLACNEELKSSLNSTIYTYQGRQYLKVYVPKIDLEGNDSLAISMRGDILVRLGGICRP